MARQCFYSFHYKKDAWRASMVRNIRAIEGNRPVNDNDWEEVKRGGDQAIENWIDDQMKWRSCTIVLIGEETANRKWINYEIKRSWEKRMGVVGIYIHGLKNRDDTILRRGADPFDYVTINGLKASLFASYCDPSGSTSKDRYAEIEEKIAGLVEKAIAVRAAQQ